MKKYIFQKKKSQKYFNSDYSLASLKKRAVKSAGITITIQIIGYGIQTIGTFILARMVTPDAFGLITMVTAFSLLLQNLGENGFTELVLQQDKITHDQLSTLFWINIALNLLLAFLFILCSPVIAWFYEEPKLTEIAMVMSLSIIFGALPIHHLALLKRNLEFFKTSMNELQAGLCSTVLAITLASIGWGYWAIAVRRVSLPLFLALGGWTFCSWIPGMPKRIAEIKSMLKFVFNTYGNFTLTYLSRNIDSVLIGKIYGPTSLGFYDRAYHLSMLLPNQLSSSLASVAISTLSKLRDDPERYKSFTKKMLSMIAFVSVPLSAILSISGQDIIIVLLGSQWNRAGEIFTAFAPSIGLMVIYSTSGWLHLSLGRSDRWLRWGVIRMVTATTSILIGLIYGPIGVAASYSIFIIVTLMPALMYAGKPIGLRFSFFIQILWKYFTAGIVSTAVTLIVFIAIDPISISFVHLNPIFRILFMSSTCGLTYIITIYILFGGDEPFRQLAGLVREVFSRKRPSGKDS